MGVLVRNVAAGVDIDGFNIPRRIDGSYFRYEMICDSGWSRVYDDSIEGLINHLIPGYINLDENQRLAARIRHAVDVQVLLQSQINSTHADTARSVSENTVLFAPRHEQPFIHEWSCEIPLVLVDAFYAPYGDAPRPISSALDVLFASNIWWLRPADSEMEYLRSLHEATAIDLNITKDEAI